jgi:membrane fusion protein (multidrug efflux system)
MNGSPSYRHGYKTLVFLGILILGAIASFWFLDHRRTVWTNDAFIDGYQVQISPDIEARITTLFVDEGDVVKGGDLVCQLDETILLSKKGDAETLVQLLEETVRLQKIEMEKLRDIYIVAKQEYDNQIISFIAFDKIDKDYKMAEAKLRVAEADLTNGIAKLGIIEEMLRHTKVYAPRDGSIAKRWVVAGDVARFSQPLFTLTDTAHIWVTANLEETKIKRLKPGNPVDIHIDAYPDRQFSGAVYVVRASAASQFALIPPDNATGNFTKVVQRVPVKILFDSLEGAPYLYPGMSVEVNIRVE